MYIKKMSEKIQQLFKYSIKNVYLILFLIQFLNAEIPSCKISVPSTVSSQRLNNIICLGNSGFAYSNFATFLNGSLIVESSKDKGTEERIFYGITKEGTPYFQNSQYFISFNASNGDNRKESENFIIILNNDDQSEYLMSISNKLNIELYDLNLKKVIMKKSVNLFLGIGEIMDCQIQTGINFKEGGTNYLFYGFITLGFDFYLKKLKFDSTDISQANIIESTKVNPSRGGMASCYITDNNFIHCIVMLSNSLLTSITSASIAIYVFNTNLNQIHYNNLEYKVVPEGISFPYFIKCIHLKGEIGVYSFYKATGLLISTMVKHPVILFKTFNGNQLVDYISSEIMLDKKEFNMESAFNDLIRVNENKICFVSTSENKDQMYIVLLSLYGPTNTNVAIRYYIIDIFSTYSFVFYKNIRANLYNNFISFAFSFCRTSNCASNSDTHYPGFMIFSYPNGTDHTDNLIEHMFSKNEKAENYLINLENYVNIDNNVFGLISKGLEIKQLINCNSFNLKYKTTDSIINEGSYLDKGENIILNPMSLEKIECSINYIYYITEPDFLEYNQYTTDTVFPSTYSESYFNSEKDNYQSRMIYYNISIEEKLSDDCNDEKCLICRDSNKNYCIVCKYNYIINKDVNNILYKTCVEEGINITNINNYISETEHIIIEEEEEEKNNEEKDTQLLESTNKIISNEITLTKSNSYEQKNNTEEMNAQLTENIDKKISFIISDSILHNENTIMKSNSYDETINNNKTINTLITESTNKVINYIINNSISNNENTDMNPNSYESNNIEINTQLSESTNKIISNIVTNNIFIKENTIIKSNSYEYNNNEKTNTHLTEGSNKISNNININNNSNDEIAIIETNLYESENQTECNIEKIILKECQNIKISNAEMKEIYNQIKEKYLSQNYNGQSQIISTENVIYQVSTFEYQKENNDPNISSIDLGSCESTLKDKYNLEKNDSLIVFKIDTKSEDKSQTYVHYEIYEPINYTLLNLSLCDNKIIINTPIDLSDNSIKLYENLKQLGYNIFDSSDDFYTDICSTFTTPNGTDMLIEERKKKIYSMNGNYTMCQMGCNFLLYNSTTKKSMCDCDIKIESIDSIINENNFSTKKLAKEFLTTITNSNFIVLKCYKLAFDFNKIFKNIGRIIMSIIFIFYFFSLLIYIIFERKKIDVFINQILEDKKSLSKNNKIIKFKSEETIKLEGKKNKKANSNIKHKKNKDLINFKKKNDNPPKKTREIKKVQKKQFTNNSTARNLELYTISALTPKIPKKNKNVNIDVYPIDEVKFDKKPKTKKENIINKINNLDIKNNNLNTNSINFENLNDEELNSLDYNIAVQIDKRSYLQYYWSLLKKDHLILFTFIPANDYNLFSLKIALFLLSFSLYFTINGFFFSDSTMNKITEDNGNFNIIYQIPQILYSSIISSIINILLKILSLSEKNILLLKKENNFQKAKNESIHIRKYIIIKFILFFILSNFFLVFFWYFITCFCAVYVNTQAILFKDTIISFGLSMVYPFALNLLPGLFRIPALRDINQKSKYLYKLSGFIALI